MGLFNGYVIVMIFGFSSSVLLQDISTKKTTPVRSTSYSSTETYGQKNDNLMTFMAEERRIRYQLEQRLDEAERKLEVTERFHESVSTELLNYRTAISKLEQINENLSRELQTMQLSQGNEHFQQNLTEIIALYEERSNTTCACNDNTVAFSAYQPASIKPVVFSNVTLNIGGAYNSKTGKFVCNQPGLYFFSISLVRSYDVRYQVCCLYINTVTEHACVVTGNGSAKDFPSGTQSEIMRLNMGDEVSLSCLNPSVLVITSGMSGFLIQAEN